MTKNIKLDVNEIQLKVEADSWEEAIRLASDPLLAERKITINYVNAMIESVRKLGPYIVIAPGLALAHSRPSPDVIETSFSIASLKSPIEFGNKDNDPVDLVIILASKDNVSHLDFLQKIVTFLGNKDKVQFLREATTKQDAIKIISLINGEE